MYGDCCKPVSAVVKIMHETAHNVSVDWLENGATCHTLSLPSNNLSYTHVKLSTAEHILSLMGFVSLFRDSLVYSRNNCKTKCGYSIFISRPTY